MTTRMATIGMVLNTAWNIYNFRLGLVKALLAAGYRVVAIAPTDAYVPQIEATGATFVPLERLSRKGVNPLQDLQLTNELARIFKAEQLDAVLLYTIKPNIYGAWAARRVGIPSISTITGLGYAFMQGGLVHQVVKRLYRSAFKGSHRVAFQNRDDKALFEELRLVAPEKTMLIKGSGINTSYFQPGPPAQPQEDFIFLFVGRLLYDKGIRELLLAAERLQAARPKTQFWVVGAIDEGNPSAVKAELVQRYHEQGAIHYWGTSDAVRERIREADVVVLPSYREGLPRVMLESLSMAKPVVTTDVAGCRETVEDGHNGYLVPAKDTDGLFEALLKMRDLPEAERARMGAAGRALALQEFDERIIVQHYLDLLEGLELA